MGFTINSIRRVGWQRVITNMTSITFVFGFHLYLRSILIPLMQSWCRVWASEIYIHATHTGNTGRREQNPWLKGKLFHLVGVEPGKLQDSLALLQKHAFIDTLAMKG